MLDSLLNMLDSPTNRKSIAQRDKCRNPNPISSRGGKVRSCTPGSMPVTVQLRDSGRIGYNDYRPLAQRPSTFGRPISLFSKPISLFSKIADMPASSVVPPPPPPPPPAFEAPPRQYAHTVDDQLRRAARQVKFVDLVSGLLTLLACSLVYLLLLAVVDHWIVGLNAPSRFVAFAGLLVGGGYYFAFRIGPLLLRRVNPEYAARAVEEVQPSLKNSLINFLQLRGERGAIREAVLFAIERRAAEDISHISVETTIDRSKIVRLGCVLIGIFLIVAVYKVASPKDPFRSAARVLAPWARINRPTRVRIESVTPGAAEIFLENHLLVTVRLRGLAKGETPVLLYSTADAQIVDRVITLHRQSDPSALGGVVFTASAPGGEIGALQNFTYRVRAGDAESESYAVRTINAPTIRVERVAYEYPAYTKLPPRVVEGGELSAVEGTIAVIHARANQTIKSATLEFDAHVASNNLRASQRLKTSDRTATGRVRLLLKSDHKTPAHRSYQLRFLAASGHRNEHPLLHQIDVTPDFSPEVEILQPQKAEIDLPINGRQIIEVRGIDPDFGLREMNLRMVSGGRELAAKQLHFSPEGQLGAVTTRFVFRPQAYRLRVGDQVVFWAVVADNREDAQGSPTPNRAKTRNYRISIVAADPTAANASNSGRSNENDPENSDPAQAEDAQTENAEAENAEAENGSGGKQPSGEEQSKRGEKDKEGSESKGGDSKDASKGSDSEKGESASKAPAAEESGGNNPDSKSGESEQNPADAGEKGSKQGEQGSQGEPQDPGGEQGGGGEGMQGEAGDPNAAAEQSGADGKGGASAASQPEGDSKSGSQGSSGQSSSDASNQGNGNASGSDASGNKGGSGQEGGAEPSAGGSNDGNPGPGERLSPDGEQDGDVFEQLQKYMKDRQHDSTSAGARKQPAEGHESGAKKPADQTSSEQTSSEGEESGEGDSEKSGEQSGEGKASEGKTAEGKAAEGKAGSPNEAALRKQGGEKGGSRGGKKPGEKGSPQDPQGAESKAGDKGEPNEPKGRAGKEASSENPEGASGAGKKEQQGEQSEAGGQAAKNQPGAPEAQEQTRGKSKSGDGQPRDDEKEGEAQSPSGSKHESETEGATDGDRSGDGGKGGGQSGKRPGNDGAGANTPGDAGAGAAQQPGQGETSSKGGQDKKADGPTGQTGQEKGPGSRQSSAGEQAGKGEQAGQGEPSQGSKDPAAEQSRSQNPGQGNGRPGEGGGAAGNQSLGEAKRPQKSTPAQRDKINLDYARRATDLSLEMLEDQKDKPDEKMLDRLGWTKNDLAKFLRRWRSLKSEARQDTPAGNAARQRLDDQLRGLGLRSDAAVERRAGRLKNDDFRELSNEGYRSQPPASYLEQYEAFKRAAARLQTP